MGFCDPENMKEFLIVYERASTAHSRGRGHRTRMPQPDHVDDWFEAALRRCLFASTVLTPDRRREPLMTMNHKSCQRINMQRPLALNFKLTSH